MSQDGEKNSRLIDKCNKIIQENYRLISDIENLIHNINYNLLDDEDKQKYLLQLARESFNLRIKFNKILSQKYILSSYLDMNVSKYIMGSGTAKFIPFDVQKNNLITKDSELRLVKDKIIKLESQLKLISELDKKIVWLCSILRSTQNEDRRN